MPSGIYRHLDANRKEIRVLELYPAKEINDLLRCDLRHISVADPSNIPSYEALSYTWGAPEFTEPLELNGERILITINLFAALQHLRGMIGQPPRVLWVDALCINQQDVEERNAQVHIMREIYSCCTLDLAWLGIVPVNKGYHFDNDGGRVEVWKVHEEDGGIWTHRKHLEKGIRLMKRIQGRELSMIRSDDREWTRRNMTYESERQHNDEIEHGDGDEEADLSIQADIYPDGKEVLWLSRRLKRLLESVFIHSGLWTRVWVMQELSCAPRVKLIGGNEELEWDVLSSFFGDRQYADAFHGTFGHHDDSEPIMQQIFVQQLRIEHQRQAIKSSSKKDSALLDVLVRFRDTKSTDPRDKIYGLLGLIQDTHSIVPDYSKPFERLYEEVTIAHINKSATLDLLCQNPFSRPKNFAYMDKSELAKRALTIPSWVADFSERRPNDILFAHRGIFNAGSATCETPAVVRDGMLQVKGIIIDQLGPIRKYWNRYYQSDQVEMMRMYFGQLKGERITTPYPHPPSRGDMKESVSHALARTLSRDCTEPPRMRRLNEEDILTRIKEREENIVGSHSFWAPQLHAQSIFTMTRGGLYVLVQQSAKEGDVVAVLDGGKVPVILRPVENKEAEECAEKKYSFVCVAYTHGYMDGEAAMEVDAGRLRKETFWLV